MFNKRHSLQKPGEELYAAFKQTFPEVGQGTSSGGQGPTTQRSSSLADALIDPTSQRQYGDLDDVKDHGATPKGIHDTWRLTPSLMDPNSLSFSAFADQPPGYYTPNPGGSNTLYHSAALDLHTPGMGMNTPLSTPHSIHSLQAQDPNLALQYLNPHLLHNAHFHDPCGNHQLKPPSVLHQQQSFATSQFLRQDSGYGQSFDSGSHETTLVGMGMATPQPQQQRQNMARQHAIPSQLRMGERPVAAMRDIELSTDSQDGFRFHATLNAATAMTKHADEIPITYLNKGQPYSLNVFDSVILPQTTSPIKYRIYVRVSFEDEQQRLRPDACWQLWKEGRGTNEAHQRGGRLQAVEFVDPNQGGDEETRRSQIKLESFSFDGFCVTWGLNSQTRSPDCSISVRFNFLSTDFSHSNGVKGIPVRLCVKTEMIQPLDLPFHSGIAEVCFTKIKLFRDHGAERKLSNDVQHVRKTIEKLRQQIQQAQQGMVNAGKRKRKGSISKDAQRPGKVLKHKRAWSMDSEGVNGRTSTEEDLKIKLDEMNAMLNSTRPVSYLYLKGEAEDDPDLFPVQLPGDNQDMTPITRQGTWESKLSGTSDMSSPSGSQDVLPTPSSSSATPKRKFSKVQQSTIHEEQDEHMLLQTDVSTSTLPGHTFKLQKAQRDSKPRSPLTALDVDINYQPPAERPIKPVACFFVRVRDLQNEYYRAVYLMQRSVRHLVNSISRKFEVNPGRITQVTHVNARGLRTIVDEDVVRELPEGQDMIVEFAHIHSDRSMKQEFITPAATNIVTDSVFGTALTASDPLEMWLNY